MLWYTSSLWSPLVFYYRAFRRNTPTCPASMPVIQYFPLFKVVWTEWLMVIYGSFESICVIVRSTILVLSKRVVSMVVLFTKKKQKS